ncbi:putative succinate-semialdehyde dehydrogenase (NAD(+)) [Helianthus annuus]|nr:putative succinate-semialdehyde dehydrogenase (NAD(+)) [Helianthus annuus]
MGDAPKIGNSLLESPQVRKITFTGLTAVGKKLMAGAAETVKKVSLELGGNAPCMVFDDADLEVALKGSVVRIRDMDLLSGSAGVVMDQGSWINI